ncbi:MAG: GNAT family N-acetyltransferase [Acidimicrobiia bacterium]|nr:GNAT family N-acetyltransferase [Acidimicrobiia bacterium]
MTDAAIPTLRTERLVLRPLVEADLAAYTEVMSRPEVRGALRLPDDFDEYQAWQQLVAFRGQWALRGTGQWAVEEAATGRLVGRAGTHHPHRDDWPGVEVGWSLHPDVWGRGYATEAGRASVDWAFRTLDIDVLHSMIHVENPRSAAVARRLGFTLVETRVFAWYPALAHGRWQLTRAEWEAGRPLS